MKVLIGFLLVLTISFGCNINRKKSEYKKVEEIVRYWNNREIIIPDSLKILGYEKNLSLENLKNQNGNKIIVIVSGNCQMCLQEIRDWIPFFDKMKGNRISNRLYFIIEHINPEYFEKVYAGDLPAEFNFFVDEPGKLAEINQLPKNKRYRTMLLDRNNKVLLIGSPLMNDDMANLFLEQLEMRE